MALLLAFTLRTPALSAQEALVLGGGGARGLAHAGVLQGLEQRGYRPELVLGTSMGAIIGALYAAGYSPEEIRAAILAVDWPGMFVEYPRILGPARDARHPILDLGRGGAGANPFPGLVTDWRANRLLVRFLFDAGVRARGDFDRLPRRYRAVAADLEDGQALALASGNLARAVRASMAVPGVFSPVRWNGRVLVDGGIADYLPVAPARELGADRVIAVDVLRPPPTIEYRDPLNVVLRAFRLILLNTLPDSATADLLIVPAIRPGMTEAAFPANPEPLLDVGLEAGLAAPVATAAGPGPKPAGQPPEWLDAVVVEGGDPALAEMVRRALGDVVPGPYDPRAIFAALDRLYATGLFDGLWPDVILPDASAAAAGGSSQDGAELHVLVETAPASSLAGAAGYDNDRGGRLWVSGRRRVSGSATWLDLSVSATGVERWLAVSATMAAVRAPPLRWSLGAHHVERDVRRFVDSSPVDSLEVRRTGGWLGLELPGVEPDRLASLRLIGEWVRTRPGSGVGDAFAVGPALRLSRLSRPTAPVGGPTELEAEARFGDKNYRRARVRASVTGEASILWWAVVADGAVVGGDAPLDVLPALGDERLIPGMRWGERRGRSRLIAGVDAAVPGPWASRARLRLRTGVVGDPVFGLEVPARSDWVSGAELAAVWSLPIGVVTAGFGVNTDGGRRLVIDVGGVF